MNDDYRYQNGPGQGRNQAAPNDNRMLLLMATLVTVGLFFVPYSDYLLYPLRLFVTFVHESGHAVAALITGGSVESLHVSPTGSGVTWVRVSPLWAWISLSGGYVGSALFGALLLQTGRLTRWQNAGRTTLYAAAFYILGVTVLWAHNPFNNPGNSFTGGGMTPDFFTMLAGVCLFFLLFALARLSSPRFANFLAAFLAVQCSLNALVDLRTLLFLTTNNGGDNDAVFMSQHYLLPPTFWALLWAGIAIVVIVLSLWSYNRAISAQIRAQGRYDSTLIE
jgi:hypothetical protein